MGVWMGAVFLSWKGNNSSESKENIFLQGGRGAFMPAGERQDNQPGNRGHSPKLML